MKQETSPPHSPGAGRVELVCVLSDYSELIGHRLVCRRELRGEERDYHLTISRRLAVSLASLFDERPFRHTRRERHSAIGLYYGGRAQSELGRAEIYVVLADGPSRLKKKLVVPEFVQAELEWVSTLSEHIDGLGRPVIQA